MLQETGERFLGQTGAGETGLEHFHRYFLAREVVRGKRVLDVASGEGYGSAILAEAASSVIGVDVSPEAVKHASERYDRKNLEFRAGPAHRLPVPDASVDVVVSFETLEHLVEHDEMLLEIKRVLTSEGVLIISTPDKFRYTEARDFKNEFHVRELHTHEFEALLRRHFPNIALYAQRATHLSVLAPLAGAPAAARAYEMNAKTGVTRDAPGLISPLYVIAVASASPNVELLGASTFEGQPVDCGEQVKKVLADMDLLRAHVAFVERKAADEVAAARAEVEQRVREAQARADASRQREDTAKKSLADLFRAKLSIEHENRNLRKHVDALQAEVDRLAQSTSWRITAPLRTAGDLLKSAALRPQLRGLQAGIKRARAIVHDGYHALYPD